GANMVNEVKSRLNAGEIPVESEVVRVDAKVLERITLDGRATITVLFDGIKKTAVASPVQVRQTWKFAKDDNDPEAHWMLESLGPAEE
ncbi:MAG: hypothetical protein KKC99_07185, partial [Proteobacteria bacterium]|nr:hypothetical protein [Pseudomonadota bacterium]